MGTAGSSGFAASVNSFFIHFRHSDINSGIMGPFSVLSSLARECYANSIENLMLLGGKIGYIHLHREKNMKMIALDAIGERLYKVEDDMGQCRQMTKSLSPKKS